MKLDVLVRYSEARLALLLNPDSETLKVLHYLALEQLDVELRASPQWRARHAWEGWTEADRKSEIEGMR